MSALVEYCEPHARPLPCPACTLAGQYEGDLLTPTPEPLPPLTRSFLKYHAANPHVLEAIRAEVRTLYTAGVRVCSIQTVFEVVRWRLTLNEHAQQKREGVTVEHGRMVSMSNSHAAYYARLLAYLHPEHLASFFDTKSSEADNRSAEWLAEAVRTITEERAA